MMQAAKTVVIPWSQIEIDGAAGLAPEHLRAGAEWRWSGGAVRIAPRGDALRLEGAKGMDELRQRAGRRAVRMIGGRRRVVAAEPDDPDGPGPRRGFVLTDGRATYGASVAEAPSGEPIAIFDEGAPPAGAETWVVRSTLAQSEGAPGVICFTPGTRIRTEQGDVPAELVEPGMRVITADNGPREVIWTGARRISGARLRAMPWLAPIMFRPGVLGAGQTEPLTVSPRHKVLLRGRAAADLFGQTEVLAAAADLVDDRSVRRLRGQAATYVHILCEGHQLLWSGGALTESFHPTPGALSTVVPEQREQIYELLPELRETGLCGPTARRALGSGEAAILRAMG